VQIVAIVLNGGLLAVSIALYRSAAVGDYLIAGDAPSCIRSCAAVGAAALLAMEGLAKFSRDIPFGVPAPPKSHWSCAVLWSELSVGAEWRWRNGTDRVIAGLVRTLGVQATLQLAANSAKTMRSETRRG